MTKLHSINFNPTTRLPVHKTTIIMYFSELTNRLRLHLFIYKKTSLSLFSLSTNDHIHTLPLISSTRNIQYMCTYVHISQPLNAQATGKQKLAVCQLHHINTALKPRSAGSLVHYRMSRKQTLCDI